MPPSGTIVGARRPPALARSEARVNENDGPPVRAGAGLSAGRASWLVGLALILTAAAALKPILWDDEVYFQFARHIVQHPLDPYGARIWVYGRTLDGLFVLAPPVLLYWWAGAMAVFGRELSLTALALFPFVAAYAFAFDSLARRFAPAISAPLTVMAATSAWPLVTVSYMLDVPAMALGLSALALFIAATARQSRGLIIMAGLFAGLAVQTKYNAAAAVAAMLIWSVFERRLADGVLAGFIAALVFCVIELLILAKYGHSHFVIHLLSAPPSTDSIARTVSRLRQLSYGYVQNVTPAMIGASMLVPFVLFRSGRWAAVSAACMIVLFALAALGFDRVLGRYIPGATPVKMPSFLTLSGLLGLGSIGYGAAFVFSSRGRTVCKDTGASFLLSWFAANVLVYVVMSPFPAARRMGEILAASALFVGRAGVLFEERRIRRAVWAVTAVSAMCGVTMLGICLVDGKNVERTAREAAVFVRASAAGHEAKHLGTLAFAHYLDAEGIARVDVENTIFKPGDLLVAEVNEREQIASIEAAGLEVIATIRSGVNLGVSVSTSFFRAGNPWSAGPDTRPAMLVFRARRATGIPLAFTRASR